MTEIEPELITIIEGPTPDFQPTPAFWSQSIFEGPEDRVVATTQLRTANGEDIQERCLRAWEEGRSVKLDFPDELRMRQQVDVMALRLGEVEEGQILQLWVSLPLEVVMEEIDEDDEEDFDDYDDYDDYGDDDDLMFP